MSGLFVDKLLGFKALRNQTIRRRPPHPLKIIRRWSINLRYARLGSAETWLCTLVPHGAHGEARNHQLLLKVGNLVVNQAQSTMVLVLGGQRFKYFHIVILRSLGNRCFDVLAFV